MRSTPQTKRDIWRPYARPLPAAALLAALVGACASGGCAVQSGAPARGPGASLSSDGPGRTEPVAPSERAPSVAPSTGPSWTLDDEQAGVVTDGVAITGARAETSDGIQRLHIDFDGSGPPPNAKLQKADAPHRLWLTLSGVRSVSADLPLLSGEGGPTNNEPAKTQSTPVVSYGRVFLGDDSAIRIELSLDSLRPHRLIASETPRRLTVEFQR